MLNAWNIMAIINAFFFYITITFIEFIIMLHFGLSLSVVQETDLFTNVAKDTVIVAKRKFYMRILCKHLDMKRIEY